MSIYNSQVAFKSGEGFNSAKGVALCGFSTEPYNNGETAQAKIGTVAHNTLLPCTPVIIKNDTAEPTGTGVYNGLNEKSLVVEKVATEQGDAVDGVILDDNCMMNDDDAGGMPLVDGFVSVALCDSGKELFMPCADDVIGKPLSTVLYWDATNKQLTATTGTNVPMPSLRILSSVVDAKVRVLDGMEVKWKDTKAVLVRI